MASESIAALFPAGRPLVYRSQLNGKTFLTHWTHHVGETAAGIHSFDLFLELDPSVLGGGGAQVRARARLDCDAELAPLRYTSETDGQVVIASFGADKIDVVLPGGVRQSVARAGAEWLMETYVIGLDALLYARSAAQGRLGEKASIKLLFVNELLIAPYTVTPAPDLAAQDGARWFRTSYDEEVLLGKDGVVQTVRNPKYGIDTVRVEPAPELPGWRDQLLVNRVKQATYTRPKDASFRSEDVVVPGAAVPLGATLTAPPGPGPHPAVLFLPGSGAIDRHGMSGEVDLGSHEILDHLSTAGFVALRFDKRGTGSTPIGPDPSGGGLDAIIDDGEAALKYLLARPEVDARRVYLVGHSEGATVALALTVRRGHRPTAIALLASRGRGMDEISLGQLEATGKQKGLSEAQIAAQLADSRRFFDLVRTGKDFQPEEVPDLVYLGARSVPWLRDHFKYPVEQLVTEVKCPLAIFHGEADFQVPISQGEELAQRASSAGVRVSFERLPGLDHLFKKVEGESTLASYFLDRRVDPGFLGKLTDWLRQH